MNLFSLPVRRPVATAMFFLGIFLLGVIAWRTRSILGGIWLHVGVALLMEAFAFARVFGLW